MAATANPIPANSGTSDLSIMGPRTSEARETKAALSVNKPVLNRAAEARMLEEENIFTFKPKVSAQSAKIAESLGTDFMSRQQQHLERQKRFLKPRTDRAVATLDKINLNTTRKNQNDSKSKPESTKEDHDSDSDDNSDGPVSGKLKAWATPSRETTSKEEHRESTSTIASQSSPTLSKSTNLKPKSSQSAINTTEGKRHCKSAEISSRKKRRKRGRSKSAMLTTDDGEDADQLGPSRSRTMPLGRPKLERKATTLGPHPDRVKNAKLTAERAIKNRKIFTIQGPYPAIRESLRRRGWVEKFYKLHMAPPPKKSPRNKRKKQIPKDQEDYDDDDDDDDDDDGDDDGDDDDDDADDDGGGKVPPWEEDNGVYGIMSRIVRNMIPTFIWSVRRDAVDPKQLRKEQVINHYGKAIFTTKVGLSTNIRNVPWYEATDPDSFFPRCYRLSHEEEKQAFIDDFRMTACLNSLKWVVDNANDMPESIDEEDGDDDDPENQKTCTNADCTKSVPGEKLSNKCVHKPENSLRSTETKSTQNFKPIQSQSPRPQNKGNGQRKKKGGRVPIKLIDFALTQCTKYIKYREHADIDQTNEVSEPSDAEWETIIQWYYQLVHEEATIPRVRSRLKEVSEILARMKNLWAQLDLDGQNNVWIVKPGAKSRGRGIMCYDNLDEMLKLVSASVMKEGKFVVQKYIERPLLIYNTKFDIRQWFLVTDWNPLTIWFYKDSYLRFCSQEYTLDDFDQSIHLSNNAIQKYCVNGERSDKLPDENMWDSEEFIDYLRSKGCENIWDERIYPGMKKAVECALLCTQDIVEYRKSAFELYGADFMLTEDYSPWLIEINSSPSMSYSTKVSHRLCSQVLEDTIKVVLDRKYDKNCDVGRFELSFKQPMVTVPPYIGLNLSLEGQSIKRPSNPVRRSEPALPDFSNRSGAAKKSVNNTETGESKSSHGPGERNERSRVLAHLVREAPRVGVYSSDRYGGKGGSYGGPAGGGGHEPKVSLMPGAWAQMCSICGKTRQARLESDPSHTGVCQCLTQDCIRTGSEPLSVPPAAQLTSFTLPLAPKNTRTKSPMLRPRRPLSSKGYWIGKSTVPCNFHIDKPKITANSSISNIHEMLPLDMTKMTGDGKFPLRYTDAGIRKPEMPARVIGNAFPKLVSRYVGRRPRDSLNICIDSYRQDNKLTIVNQSFL